MLEAISRLPITTDVVEAIRQVLRASAEPLTPARIRARLPVPLRSVAVETIQVLLRRQVAAQVFVLYPKYRSDQDRYWDRPLRQHVDHLLRKTLRDGPMTRVEVRRRLPSYARVLADNMLDTLVAQGRVFEHPSCSRRAVPRLALHPPDPRLHLRPELDTLFDRLERRGFSRRQVRDAALAILQEEVWSDVEPFAEDPPIVKGRFSSTREHILAPV